MNNKHNFFIPYIISMTTNYIFFSFKLMSQKRNASLCMIKYLARSLHNFFVKEKRNGISKMFTIVK